MSEKDATSRTSREIRFHLLKEFRAAGIEFYLHKACRAARIRFYRGTMRQKIAIFKVENSFCSGAKIQRSFGSRHFTSKCVCMCLYVYVCMCVSCVCMCVCFVCVCFVCVCVCCLSVCLICLPACPCVVTLVFLVQEPCTPETALEQLRAAIGAAQPAQPQPSLEQARRMLAEALLHPLGGSSVAVEQASTPRLVLTPLTPLTPLTLLAPLTTLHSHSPRSLTLTFNSSTHFHSLTPLFFFFFFFSVADCAVAELLRRVATFS